MTGPRLPHGQSTVEFALVLPLLIVLLFAVINFGLALYEYNTLGFAASQGAHRAMLTPDVTPVVAATPDQTVIPAAVATVVRQALSAPIDPAQVTVATTFATSAADPSATYATVHLQYVHHPFALAHLNAFTISLQADRTARVGGP